ncbi:sensor histidine kinase [Adhaeribacter aquaticus]|uniref:sensor histidine kinase n=1 Tax=Adhaeribacter aquaticus TaxID=299567 RepID=UPI0003FD8503|nr:HAMP domain-containing sensor histidine kinase [Adhaeribacter aquaticus]
MNLTQLVKSKLYTSDLDRQIIQEEVAQYNYKAVQYIIFGALPIHLFIIFSFYSSLTESGPIEIQWRKSIIGLHTTLLVIHTTLAFLALYIKYRKKQKDNLKKYLFNTVCLVLPLWGVAAVSFDQLVTPSIVAYFLNCAACSLALMIKPRISIFYFLFTFLAFFFGISYFQTNPDFLLTNKVNGFGGTATFLGISLLIWRNNLIRFRQSRLILHQTKELEKNYEELKKTSAELEKLNATKDKFFSIIAHDLRGPLSSTLGVSELFLNEQLFTSEEERKPILKEIHNRLSNIFKLLDNLLLWAQNQTEGVSFVPTKLDLHNLVQTNIDMLHFLAAEKKLSIQNQVPTSIYVQADKDMLNTVLRNLLSNAIKFTFPSGKIEIQTELTTTAENPKINVSIKDSGKGMNHKMLNDLFKLDKRITMPGTESETGTGLGLILCKEFIQINNGQIWATSKEGQGSCFSFSIPLFSDN